ncbi:MAG: CBS domain-containing protein [Pseudomonadota bacterium]
MNPYSRLSAAALKWQPATAARVLEKFPAGSVARFLAAANTTTAATIVGHFTPAFAADCLATIETPLADRVLERLTPDYQLMLLRQLTQDDRAALLGRLEPGLAATLTRLLPYPEGTAGAIMEAPLASIPEDMTVRDAIKRIKRIRRGTKSYLYATSSTGRLTGVMTLHELLNSLPTSPVRDIMDRHVACISPLLPLEAVLDSPYWQDYHALPVTDTDNILLGIIRQKHLRRLQEQLQHGISLEAGINSLLTLGELFATTTLPLLSALISTTSATDRRRTP